MRISIRTLISAILLAPVAFSQNAMFFGQNAASGLAPIALISSTTGTAQGSAPGNSGTITTTGATLLVIGIGDSAVGGFTVSDHLANTWHGLTMQMQSSGSITQWWYAYSSSGGGLITGSDFVTVTGDYPAFVFWAFGSTLTSGPLDQQNGTTNSSASTIQPGSVTPSIGGELVVASCAGTLAASYSISAGFTGLVSLPFMGGTNYGGAFAYQIQTTATPVNPTWTITGGPASLATSIGTFKP